MTKLKENKRRLIPRYAVLPLLSVLVMNFVTYYLTSCLTAARLHMQMALPLDARVPLVPAFIVVYILAYGQWGIGYVLIARESEAVGSRILSGEILAKAICLVLFLAVPTTMVRPTGCFQLADPADLSGGCAGESFSLPPLPGQLGLPAGCLAAKAHRPVVPMGVACVYAACLLLRRSREAARIGGYPRWDSRGGGRAVFGQKMAYRPFL